MPLQFLQSVAPETAFNLLDVPAALTFAYGVLRLFVAQGRADRSEERTVRREEAEAARETGEAMRLQAEALTASHEIVKALVRRGTG